MQLNLDTQLLNAFLPDGILADEIIAKAAEMIRAGGLAAFPTETVYGLGANALDGNAVAKIFEAKQRPLNDPIIVHVADGAWEELADAHNAEMRQMARALARACWPGPLTLVLPRGGRIPANVTAGLDKVGLRMPAHPVALALIRASGVPIAAPSANRFGHTSPTTAAHVLDDLRGRIDLVLDGGPASIGVESTVLDLTGAAPQILRPGGLSRERLEEVLARPVSIRQRQTPNQSEAMPAPGMLERHYAPGAKLILCKDTPDLLARREAYAAQKLRVGLLITQAQSAACAGLTPQFVMGNALAEIARELYAGMRALDAAGAQVILITQVERTGLGEAIADRLRRAAA